jgi:hypothetical protein
MALGSTKPLTEMSPRNFPAGKKRPARRADKNLPSVSRIYENVGASGSRNPKDLRGLYRETSLYFSQNLVLILKRMEDVNTYYTLIVFGAPIMLREV